MQEVQKTTTDVKGHGFVWFANGGRAYRAHEMETRHLFNTVRMIWNHTVPDHLKFKPYRRYVFAPLYTPAYMQAAIREILPILNEKRGELTVPQRNELDLMYRIAQRRCLEDQTR